MGMNPRSTFHGVTIADDPKPVHLEGGKILCGMRVAYNGQYKDKRGAVVKTTSWFSFVFYGKNAEILCKYCHKGSLLTIEAEPVENTWKDEEGKTRHQIEFRVQRFTMLYKKPKTTEHNASAAPTGDPDFDASLQGFGEDDTTPF